LEKTTTASATIDAITKMLAENSADIRENRLEKADLLSDGEDTAENKLALAGLKKKRATLNEKLSNAVSALELAAAPETALVQKNKQTNMPVSSASVAPGHVPQPAEGIVATRGTATDTVLGGSTNIASATMSTCDNDSSRVTQSTKEGDDLGAAGDMETGDDAVNAAQVVNESEIQNLDTIVDVEMPPAAKRKTARAELSDTEAEEPRKSGRVAKKKAKIDV
jgi:hypothetical protein